MLGNQLWGAIYDLYELLVVCCNEEAKYQNYFERHKIPFSVLGLSTPVSFEKQSKFHLPYDQELGFTPEPDFIAIKMHTSTLVVVELKTPFVGKITTSRRDGNRSKLSAEAETYVSQGTEYAKSITGRLEARDYLKRLFGIGSVSDVEVVLIYALASENPEVRIEKLVSNRKVPTEIIHYDSLFDMMAGQYIKQTGIPIGSKGITAVYHICFKQNQIHERSVVSEGKSIAGDCVLLEYSDRVIFFSITDTKGQTKTLQAEVPSDEVTFIRLEFSSDSKSTFMCLTVNNFAQDMRVTNMPMAFRYDNDSFSIGASLGGEKGACCSLHEYYLSPTILDIKDRLGSFHYFKRKQGVPGKVTFMGNHYMYRDQSNNMVQPNPLFQPKYERKNPTNQ